MSELSNTKAQRLEKLLEVARLTLETGNARSFILKNEDFIPTVIPSDFITLFDELVKENYTIPELKTCANKVLNIFNKAISSHKQLAPLPGSFLWVLEQNNSEMDKVLKAISPVFKAFIKDTDNTTTKAQLLRLFEKLESFTQHYVIKENILFPVIEQHWPDYRCLQIMWSFHDDIRKNIKSIINDLRLGISDLKQFNRNMGDVFFNMQAIKFREERILFPYILSTISEEELETMNYEAAEMGYPFVQSGNIKQTTTTEKIDDEKANLGTGSLTVEQIKLIFNHLPVDITYVDEHDKVRYFSTPRKRIFPRTNAIIGREVKNCHPPESVHVVEQIVESFKSGAKDTAEFWIKMKGEYILIQYFAIRDKQQNYKGVIEVTQEISDIKALEGEKRLLDW